MGKNRKSLRSAVRDAAKSFANVAAGRAAMVLLALSHRCDRVWISNVGGAIMRTIGPWLPEHRVGRANLRAAFPEKTDAEIEEILRGVWDNLGRVGAEIAHLDHICSGDRYNRNFIDYGPHNIERFLRVKDDGKPAVIFAAHLANWELPAVIACMVPATSMRPCASRTGVTSGLISPAKRLPGSRITLVPWIGHSISRASMAISGFAMHLRPKKVTSTPRP